MSSLSVVAPLGLTTIEQMKRGSRHARQRGAASSWSSNGSPNAATVTAMQAKFPAQPAHRATSVRAAAPPANDSSCDEVVSAVRSFPRHAAPVPAKMRPDFLDQSSMEPRS